MHGYALDPPTDPNLFTVCGIKEKISTHTLADIGDLDVLTQTMQKAGPDIVFHLAAQPLVRQSYANPVGTYLDNVMGTVNLLEAVRRTESVKAVVNVTSDKCYENREWVWPYREGEHLGGYDPYSSSKACSELVTASYRRSFFSPSVAVATARAGNVIGGGDWGADRLVPDFLRAQAAGRPLKVRSPGAVRPWQHVLEPLAGYLQLAESLYSDGSEYEGAWNFGPNSSDAYTVQWVIEQLCKMLPNTSWEAESEPQPHEANVLKLDSSKARTLLDWHPHWSACTALKKTAAWHKALQQDEDMTSFSLKQIREYEETDIV